MWAIDVQPPFMKGVRGHATILNVFSQCCTFHREPFRLISVLPKGVCLLMCALQCVDPFTLNNANVHPAMANVDDVGSLPVGGASIMWAGLLYTKTARCPIFGQMFSTFPQVLRTSC